MGEESCEMHPDDDKSLSEKNKKRIVKTPAQVEALEKFYNEHKYPSESMKIQLAESIGLTEKQVSGWFCHRRLKDKKLMNGENYATGRQDRSSGVIQDRGSGHRQDSCGSTKQGDDKNFDTREVESGRLTSKEFSAADLTFEHGSHYAGNYNRTEDTSSGSSSSLRNMPNHETEVPPDAAISRYLIPKFPADIKGVKPRSGPSGYLKVKGQIENAAVTAVKRQLGKHYREDGPPLGVEFDPLPPGAFESSVQDPVEENYCDEEADLPASPDFSNVRQSSKIRKGSEYHSSMTSFNNVDGMDYKMRRGSDIPDGYIHQKSRIKTPFSNPGAYHPRSYSSLELAEGSARDIPGIESRDEYGLRRGPGVEAMTMDSVSSRSNLKYGGGKSREKPAESWSRKYGDVGTRVALGGNIDNEHANLTMKRNEYINSGEKGLSREIIKDDKIYRNRGTKNESQVNIPFKNDLTGPQRTRQEFSQQQHLKTSSVMDNLPQTYHQVMRSAAEMPSSFSEDEESGGTSSSVD